MVKPKYIVFHSHFTHFLLKTLSWVFHAQTLHSLMKENSNRAEQYFPCLMMLFEILIFPMSQIIIKLSTINSFQISNKTEQTLGDQ